MEELDMIRRARQYLEALSSGTDPIGKKTNSPRGNALAAGGFPAAFAM